MHYSHRETVGKTERGYRYISTYVDPLQMNYKSRSYHCVLVNLAAKKFNHPRKFLISTNLKEYKGVRKDYQPPRH